VHGRFARRGAATVDLLAPLWGNRLAATAVVMAVAAVVGIATAGLTPRGPLTGGQVVATTVVMLLLGVMRPRSTRSRT